MSASAGLYRATSNPLERNLISSLVGTSTMINFATAIIRGEVEQVRAMTSYKKVPKTWYDKAFDTEGRKLVAFTVHVALVNKMRKEYEDILLMVIKSSHKKSDITTCIYKKRHECLAHVVARHASETHHVNTIGTMLSNHLKNRGATWYGMLSKVGPNGRLPGNHATHETIAEHMGMTKKHVARTPTRNTRNTRNTRPLDRELQTKINGMSTTELLRLLSLLENNSR